MVSSIHKAWIMGSHRGDFSVAMSSPCACSQRLAFSQALRALLRAIRSSSNPGRRDLGRPDRTAAKIQTLVNLKLQNKDSIWFEIWIVHQIWDSYRCSNLWELKPRMSLFPSGLGSSFDWKGTWIPSFWRCKSLVHPKPTLTIDDRTW